jgi:hypothetical protein
MKNIAQRVELQMLRKKLVEIQQKIGKIESNCKHVLVQVHANPKYDDNGSARCENCDRYFSWWCPDSPDHACHYITHEVEGYLLTARAVELVDGTEHILHDYEGDPEYENDDGCVFCHEPDERK